MSIDFDSNALQTQHEEDEYDQEDYAREQELHKLLTDLPDDMLEDSRDSSSPELDDSPCSNHGNGKRPQHAWNGQREWANQQRPPALTEENYEDEGSYHQDHSYENGQGPLGQAGDQGYPYKGGGGVYEDSSCTNDFSTDRGYQQEPYSPSKNNYNQFRNHFQNMDSGEMSGKMTDHYKATFHPRQPAQMFNPDAHQNGHLPNGFQNGHQNGHLPNGFQNGHQNGHLPNGFQNGHQNGHLPNGFQNGHQNGHLPEGHLEQLQRDFLDSRQTTLEGQQLAQLQVLHEAQARQLEELEQKVEDGKRSIRFLEHQLAIVKDEKEGLAVSLKESSRALQDTQSREAQLQANLSNLEGQIHTLTEREQESQKKLCVAEAEVDSVQQQMMGMCRSDTLARAREQHDRDLNTLREQHDARVLSLQQMLDSHTQALQEQTELGQRLREQVRQLERQREEEQVDRASVINALTQRLEDSQKQCAKLLHTGSVQEMSQMQMKLQQAQSAKNMSEEMNKALQEELNELKDQVRLYENAVKLRVVSVDSEGDWDNQLSDSYAELGIKKGNWKNTHMHSSTPVQGEVCELRVELQRCLASLKEKRQRISALQQDLHTTQEQLQQLQNPTTHTRAHAHPHAHASTKDSPKRESNAQKPPEASMSGPELTQLQEERQRLQDRVEALERRNAELKQSEEKVKAANSELCTKMREMIHDLDQEKQEAQQRYERTQQQFRDDVVNRVRSELTEEHQTHMEELRAQHQQQIQTLESKLVELQGEMTAVQECYISICKEKDRLEESLTNRTDDEESARQQESERMLEELRAQLQREHQGELCRLRSQWEAELQERLQNSLDSAQQNWQHQQQEVERAWSVRLERALEEEQTLHLALTQEGACQTEGSGGPSREGACQTEACGTAEASPGVPREEVEAQLQEQREKLQKEAQEEQTAAVEEAVRRTQRELQQKHLKEVAKHVEGAVSRAHSRWLQELPTHPEYKASLQTQISAAVRAAKDQWQESLEVDRVKLEQSRERIGQLQEEVRSLQDQQETLLGAELAAARASWTCRQQEEISRLQNQHQAQLEQELGQAQEEAQQEVKEGLQEALQLLRRERESKRERTEERSDGSDVAVERSRGGGLRELCREALTRAMALARQDWNKRSEEKLRRVLKEMQERHQKEIIQLQNSSAECSDGSCVSKRCSEMTARLQKKNQELQRQLEKTSRQLQQTTREHRTTLHTLTEEHKEALRQEREAHARALEGTKKSAQEATQDGQKSLQAGLEEMKEQYTSAVDKIRADMLRYLQESTGRAAELIRVEVQRERQETARRMRHYYLTCLQELLTDGGHSKGAEKKIINAASKLTAMAKVLETPVIKKKLGKGQTAQEEVDLMSVPVQTLRVPSSLAPLLEAGDPGGGRSCAGEVLVNSVSLSSVQREHTPSELKPPVSAAALLSAAVHSSSSRGELGVAALPEVRGQRPQASLAHVTLRNQRRDKDREREPAQQQQQQRPRRSESDPGRPAELQSSSGGSYLKGPSLLSQESCLVQEPPVRDGGQNDWSISSAGSSLPTHTHTHTLSTSTSFGSYLPAQTHTHTRPLSSSGSYLPPHAHTHTHTPVADLFRPLSALGDEFDAGSSFLGETSDSTIYREIGKTPVSACVDPPESSQGLMGRLAPKSHFSELKGPQRDSGFDSPPSQLRKRLS